MRTPANSVVIALASLVLTSCGGGGDGGSGGTPTTPAANEFLITGPIVNLKGSGMVLVNTGSNGVVEAAIPASVTSFEFPRLATGQSYNVTIKSQPTNPSQICTVTGGVGKVTGPTTTISINCVTSTFEVRGSIGGLTGAGLALSLNGGTAQAITAGSTVFTFPPIESGALYAVTIAAQPAGLTCVINNGAGSVSNATVTTVQVICAAIGSTPTITVGGQTAGLGINGLTLSLNGGTPFAVAASGGNGTFTFPPTTLQAGDLYSVVIVTQPNSQGRASCGLARARGRVVGATNVTNVFVHCSVAGPQYQNGGFVTTLNGKRQFLIIWPDNNFALVQRADQPACPNLGPWP